MGQPKPWDESAARACIEPLRTVPGGLLPMLHALQDEFGYLPDEAIPQLMDAINQSRAEIVGVIEFYHDFRRDPAGQHTLKVCGAESCQSMGAEALTREVEVALSTSLGGTTADGAVTLERVFCLGNCALSPAVMLDDRPCGRATLAKVERLIAEVAR